MRQELKRDSCINGDIPAQTDARKKIDAADCTIVVYARGLKRSVTNGVEIGYSGRQRTRSMPKIEVIRHEKLNAHLRPKISETKPNKKAPILWVSY